MRQKFGEHNLPCQEDFGPFALPPARFGAFAEPVTIMRDCLYLHVSGLCKLVYNDHQVLLVGICHGGQKQFMSILRMSLYYHKFTSARIGANEVCPMSHQCERHLVKWVWICGFCKLRENPSNASAFLGFSHYTNVELSDLNSHQSIAIQNILSVQWRWWCGAKIVGFFFDLIFQLLTSKVDNS